MKQELQEELNQKITKLPVWAQKHIESLTRQRDRALEAQKAYLDGQMESPFFVEYDGPKHSDKRYVQADTITVRYQGVQLRVDANPYGNTGEGIRLQWEGTDHREVAFIPAHHQGARLVSQKHMH
jgi:hypothetical protein